MTDYNLCVKRSCARIVLEAALGSWPCLVIAESDCVLYCVTVLLCYSVCQHTSITWKLPVEVSVLTSLDTRTVCGVGGEDSVWRVVLLAAPSGLT